MEKTKANNARTSGWCSSSKRFSSSPSASGCKRKTKRRRKIIRANSSCCYLPFDLITQVLIRLPMKSVLRFGCVSKQWRDLTSSAPFKNLYDAPQLSQEPSKLLLWKNIRDYDKLTQCLELQVIDLTKKRKNEEVYSGFECHKREFLSGWYYASSCHGLVCFADKLSLEALVINPITRQDVKILLPEHHKGREWAYRIISIGFLPCTQQFKIVCWASGRYLPRHCSDRDCEILTFNTKAAADTSEVRELSPSRTSTMRMHFDHSFEIQHPISICIGGVIYWLVVLETGKAAVLTFDLEKEEGMIIPGPDDFPVYDRHEILTLISFIELRGSLCIVGKVVISQRTSIWMLTKKQSEPNDGAVYHWDKLLSNVMETRPPTKEVVFLNVESRKFHYLHIHKQKESKKKKSIKRFGDGPWEVFDLALIPNTSNHERTNRILFSESFNFLC